MIHAQIIILIISYTLTGAFVFTVIITCLSLIGWIEFRDSKQQQKLFYILVVELVVICVGFFGNFLKLNPQDLSNQINKIQIERDKYRSQVDYFRSFKELTPSTLQKDIVAIQMGKVGVGKIEFSSSSSPKLENDILILSIPDFQGSLANLSSDGLVKDGVIKNIAATKEQRELLNKLLRNNLTIYNEDTKSLEVPGFAFAQLSQNILTWR